MPILINIIQIAQIACCRIRRFNWITAFVHQTIHFQTVNTTSRNHKLPQTTSTRFRNSACIQSRLNNRQIFQFQRYIVFRKCSFKNREIISFTYSKHIFHLMMSFGKHFYQTTHNTIVWHFHHIRQFLHALNINFVGISNKACIF